MQQNTKALLLRAGLVPLPAWLFITTLAGFFAVDYNPIALHVSMMTLQEGMAHLLVNIAALTSGAAIIIFGAGIWLVSNRAFSGGALCWVFFGIAMIANGIWPTGSPMHGLYIIGIFNILAPALSLLDIWDETLRNKLHGMTVFVSLSSVLYLWLLLNGFDPEGYSGLSQRVFGSINFLWPLFFAIQFTKLEKQ